MKEGYKTTEFWITILSNVIGIIQVLQGSIDPKSYLIVMAIVNGAYTTLRTLAKQPSITTVVENK